MKPKTIPLILTFLLLVALGACNANGGGAGGLTASGFIATDHIRMAPEISGRLLSIQVSEGDSVQAGDVLFTLNDELLRAHAAQAQTAVDLANASLEAAKAQLASAQMQVDLTVQQVRLGDVQNRSALWNMTPPDAVEQPIWYFEKSELLAAAQIEVDAAQKNLETEQANLEKELHDASNEDFIAVETRLLNAQMAYQIADQTLSQAQSASDTETLETAAQEQVDAAESELDAIQVEYDRMLSTSSAESVLEARARLAVARARLEQARQTLTQLQTGDDSLQVQAARSTVSQAEKAIAQAQANLLQAQAALNVINLQLERCIVTAPAAGTVLAVNVEAGELISAGGLVLTLGQLEEVDLTVYVPEDEYGQISLGQQVSISVDSYPGRQFSGQVQYIADQAEFTPRNVQTVEGRKSTVFAVKIHVANPDQALKPGMPADVNFNIP